MNFHVLIFWEPPFTQFGHLFLSSVSIKRSFLVPVEYICIHGTLSELSTYKDICILKWSWFCSNSYTFYFTYFLLVRSEKTSLDQGIIMERKELNILLLLPSCSAVGRWKLISSHSVSKREESLKHHLCLRAPPEKLGEVSDSFTLWNFPD